MLKHHYISFYAHLLNNTSTSGHLSQRKPPPQNSVEAVRYLRFLIARPSDFPALLKLTIFYSRLCL